MVTKMDLAPEKEREKLIRFVEGRLENDFGLEHPKVYGCAAAEALRDYSENSAAESRWTAEFEQMLLEIFASLSGRREQLVAILIMLGSATTVSCYVMARNMGHEGVLTSSTVMLTTMFSAFTVTGWVYILRSLGLI